MAQDFSIFPSMNFVDLGLYQFGREDCEPAHSYGPAIRNHYLFHYILSGKGTFMWQDGKRRENRAVLKAGQGFLISPGQITTYVVICPGEMRNPCPALRTALFSRRFPSCHIKVPLPLRI